MGNTMPATVAGFGDLLGRVDDGLRELERIVRRVFADCERLLPWLGPLAEQVRRLLDRLAQLVRRVLDEVGEFLRAPGDPVLLWRTGDRWSNDVALHVGNPVGTLTVDFVHGDDDWQGPAAAAYRATLPPQQRALQQVQSIAQQLGDSLHDVALRLAAFWVGLGVALASLAAEMLAAAAVSATVAAAPAGLAAAAAASSKFLAIMSGLVMSLMTLLTAILQAQARASRQLADNAAFPGPPAGHWPVAVTASLADASMSDGDGSDWRLRP